MSRLFVGTNTAKKLICPICSKEFKPWAHAQRTCGYDPCRVAYKKIANQRSQEAYKVREKLLRRQTVITPSS